MSSTMEENLSLITGYIKKLQNNEKMDGNSIEIKKMKQALTHIKKHKSQSD